MTWWLALALAAFAQDAPADPPPEAEEPDDVETVGDADAFQEVEADGQPTYLEVLVIGDHILAAARDEVVKGMKTLGWRAKRKGDGRIVFKAPEAWMGKATLMPSGDMEFTIPPLALSGMGQSGATYRPEKQLDNDPAGGGLGVSFGAPAAEARKVRDLHRGVYAEVRDEVLAYRQVLQQRHFSGYVSDLPARLDALWFQGEALDGGPTVTDPAKKRAQVLDFWSTRTDTPEGRTVMRTIEIWLRETVMDSDAPVTAAEAAGAEGRRSDGRRLEIF